MVRITEELVRKRAEHNEMQISTLEEISLHQQDIERLEHLDKWCRDLKILYLQSNLIPKIENVSRLKKLEYLNLALNNIEKIENLEGCESLKKLDLTVNFVGELTSVECLKNLYNFRELFLTGNPCADYEHYRNFVIATLPQLQWLDGIEIERSERIKAIQNLPYIRGRILEQQESYRKKRAKQKEKSQNVNKGNAVNSHENDESSYDSDNTRDETNAHGVPGDSNKENRPGFNGRWYTDINEGDKRASECKQTKEDDKTDEEKNAEFWNQKTGYTPESRIEVHNYMKELKKKEEKQSETETVRPRRLFSDDGRPFNVNEPKVEFSLTEDNENIILDVAVFKHMDTSLVDCDVQPHFVKVTLKGKVLQLCLPEEVNVGNSTAKRSQITGHLLVTMPKVKQSIVSAKTAPLKSAKESSKEKKKQNESNYLEVDAEARKGVDVTRIIADNEAKKATALPFGSRVTKTEIPEHANSDSFVDDPSVPPLL
ncbi:unnamed protein product [Candidula unifasciata]|uniref:U2A'/phosphoprotein 32 family A C-terminal domain-containing protein n=1 Tax=Candidula unifasciata TaxID=100452 RepID=A0A8S3YUI3_9EUPU|nr:unnamed protein product [Candidula unifasciata]